MTSTLKKFPNRSFNKGGRYEALYSSFSAHEGSKDLISWPQEKAVEHFFMDAQIRLFNAYAQLEHTRKLALLCLLLLLPKTFCPTVLPVINRKSHHKTKTH
jgi:hypothetical protein